MNIIAADDEKLALEGLMTEIALAAPDADIAGFRNGKECLEYCDGKDKIDIAFCDIEMKKMNGLSLGEELMRRYPDINLIYTTGFSEYAVEAISMRCSGYILKPVTAEKIKKELANLRHPITQNEEKRLYAKTFGKFEVFVGGYPLRFKYQKTKELLAYLIDRQGGLCSNAEIIEVLWEDDALDSSHGSYLKNIRTDLVNTLSESGCLECITRGRGEMGILKENIDCDYYDYLENKDVANAGILFKGEYMSQYSWGEYTLANILKESGQWN